MALCSPGFLLPPGCFLFRCPRGLLLLSGAHGESAKQRARGQSAERAGCRPEAFPSSKKLRGLSARAQARRIGIPCCGGFLIPVSPAYRDEVRRMEVWHWASVRGAVSRPFVQSTTGEVNRAYYKPRQMYRDGGLLSRLQPRLQSIETGSCNRPFGRAALELP